MYKATYEQIRYAHRRLLMTHHPDKTGKQDDPVFLNISKAFDTLTDKEKRRDFDSQCDFDESIPRGKVSEEKFFRVYAPVFERNARFSEAEPVPDLGGPDSPDDEVLAFYDFWFAFKSWRTFTGEDEHDLAEAENREDKRWMMQENQAARRKAKKKEMRRVLDLVENAHKNDPRVRRINAAAKAAKKAEKAKRKAARFAAANKEKLEREAKAKAEADAKAEAEAKAKAEKQAEKLKKIKEKKAKRKVAKVFRALWPEVDDDELRAMMADKSVEDLRAMADRGDLEELQTAVLGAEAMTAAKAAKAAEERRAKEEAERKRLEAEKLAKEVEWTADEDSMLAKGVKKFPGGTRKRWCKIADFVMTLGPGKCSTRTPKDCIKRWDSLKAHLADHKVSTADAFAKFTERTGISTAEMDVQKERAASSGLAPGDSKMPDGTVWTLLQQQQLEQALKDFPPTMPKKERWRAINRSVKGRTAKDCVARVRWIAANLRKEKEGR
jgi:DnaJ family protein C protein 2